MTLNKFFEDCLCLVVGYLKEMVENTNYVDGTGTFGYVLRFLMVTSQMCFFRTEIGTPQDFMEYWLKLKNLILRKKFFEVPHTQEKVGKVQEIIKHIEGGQIYDEVVDYGTVPTGDDGEIDEAIVRLHHEEWFKDDGGKGSYLQWLRARGLG